MHFNKMYLKLTKKRKAGAFVAFISSALFIIVTAFFYNNSYNAGKKTTVEKQL
jgi:hypothetical protein